MVLKTIKSEPTESEKSVCIDAEAELTKILEKQAYHNTCVSFACDALIKAFNNGAIQNIVDKSLKIKSIIRKGKYEFNIVFKNDIKKDLEECSVEELEEIEHEVRERIGLSTE